ncbi:O-succinylbenzoic acid-CoA ligase MenE or related acyl-CoA synthetase (AMP-forming) [Cupriavidus necator]|uniref:Acyl-CoA synthetase (AMP-forming)/AMP-acid ligase II n=1 Tax=Cupriavidus necator (strain ATCC 17699 / DSM 428 / KCTC 22496 / NCIMB 10442 / H16 / Stanier 337) TaxID=381666 RepID=Q0KC36_CUPNH|nr:long-chain fatty acid--CoA ligase [Cupriavidus necator]QCC02608.1 long-chain fatty acid--CoA ligase [Cupriavidus necator H16]QQB78493.1 long-chain fatty acid--CoA ligase [Cupriavidus necator]WKA42742.1 long-chain fatty acid--CoA ligase [Cupriavidus necator]CAJ92435.1 Acyl-CoA synthetase (AMP-forming)/AMP-acid ligase II [Cupriavidus necator H16]
MTHNYLPDAGVTAVPAGPLAVDAAVALGDVPRVFHMPHTTLAENLEISARRFPDKVAVQFYHGATTYAELLAQVERMAGYLQQACGVRRGDRVVLLSQNSPQFIVAYHAILRADAVVVPANAMLLEDELRHIVTDSGAVAAFAASELVGQVAPLVGTTPLRHVIVHHYGDALPAQPDDGLSIPDWVQQRSSGTALPAGAVHWQQAMAAGSTPSPRSAGLDDLCMLPYTSGTTGAPKACMHTHRTVMVSVAGSQLWRRSHAESTFLAVAPMFHLLGLQNGVNAPVYMGGTIVLLPRWDRRTVAQLVARHRVTFWAAPPPMLVEFFAQPGIESFDLSSLACVVGGGAAVPDSTARLMKERYGLQFVEGYGLTETASFIIANPLAAARSGHLGVPTYGVDARVIDPATLTEVPRGEVGEIVVHGAQVMLGYWNQPAANAESFITIDGKRFFRTGDLASVDADGYFVMRDRLKRMVNASGYKVWPAEVEAILHTHPAILEACVIAARDPHRGETVKAVIVRRDGAGVSEEELLAWCRTSMATYKAPRIVQFVERLPRSATGKIAWRELQEQEMQGAPLPNHKA